MTPINLNRTAISTIIITTTTTKTVINLREKRKLFTHPVRHVEKQTTQQRNAILQQMQLIDHLPSMDERKDRIKSQRESIKATPMELLKLQSKI